MGITATWTYKQCRDIIYNILYSLCLKCTIFRRRAFFCDLPSTQITQRRFHPNHHISTYISPFHRPIHLDGAKISFRNNHKYLSQHIMIYMTSSVRWVHDSWWLYMDYVLRMGAIYVLHIVLDWSAPFRYIDGVLAKTPLPLRTKLESQKKLRSLPGAPWSPLRSAWSQF